MTFTLSTDNQSLGQFKGRIFLLHLKIAAQSLILLGGSISFSYYTFKQLYLCVQTFIFGLIFFNSLKITLKTVY